MTLKKHTDNARAFTFRHEFESVDHANVTSTAILGYMVGTYEQPHNRHHNQQRTRLITPIQCLLIMYQIVTYLSHSTVFVIALRAILRVAVKHR